MRDRPLYSPGFLGDEGISPLLPPIKFTSLGSQFVSVYSLFPTIICDFAYRKEKMQISAANVPNILFCGQI